jgi:hypothetical protein
VECNYIVGAYGLNFVNRKIERLRDFCDLICGICGFLLGDGKVA